MKVFQCALLSACLCAIAAPAFADGLKTTDVSSTLSVTAPGFTTNTFSTTPITIASGKEYDAITAVSSGGKNASAYTYFDTYKANFTNKALAVNDVCTETGKNGCNHDPFAPFTMTFTDTAFAEAVFTLINEPAGYSWSRSGDTISVSYTGGSDPAGIFRLGIVPAPEPESLALMGTGLISVLALARRRIFS